MDNIDLETWNTVIQGNISLMCLQKCLEEKNGKRIT